MSLAGELLSGKCRASIWVKTRKHLEMIVVLKETDREQALETLLRDSREKKKSGGGNESTALSPFRWALRC